VIQKFPTWFRIVVKRAAPLEVLLSVIWAIQEFSKGRPCYGAYALALGAWVALSYFFARKQEVTLLKIPSEFQFYEICGFFGGCAFVGVTTFILAALDIAHFELIIGILCLIVAVISVFVVIYKFRTRDTGIRQ
jgi:hypothetical protein